MFVLNLTIAVMLLKYDEFAEAEGDAENDQELQEYGE